MYRERPTDEAHASRSGTKPVESFDPRAYNLRIVAQTEVVVRREYQYPSSAFHLDASGLRRVQIIEAFVYAVGFQLLDARFELVVEFAIESHRTFSSMRSRRLLCPLRRI